MKKKSGIGSLIVLVIILIMIPNITIKIIFGSIFGILIVSAISYGLYKGYQQQNAKKSNTCLRKDTKTLHQEKVIENAKERQELLTERIELRKQELLANQADAEELRKQELLKREKEKADTEELKRQELLAKQTEAEMIKKELKLQAYSVNNINEVQNLLQKHISLMVLLYNKKSQFYYIDEVSLIEEQLLMLNINQYCYNREASSLKNSLDYIKNSLNKFVESDLYKINQKMKSNAIDFDLRVKKLYSLYDYQHFIKNFSVQTMKDFQQLLKWVDFEDYMQEIDSLDIDFSKEIEIFDKEKMIELLISNKNIKKIEKLNLKKIGVDSIQKALYVILVRQMNLNSISLLLEMILNYGDLVSVAEERYKIYKMKLERERLLNGDFSEELEYQAERDDYNKIVSGIDFEIYLARLFEHFGYHIQLTKNSGDQGGDIILIRNDEKIVVQAKYYSSTVGNKAIQEVVSSINFYSVKRGAVVTNNYFTQSAIELAKVNSIILIDKSKLDEIIRAKIHKQEWGFLQ